MRLPLSLFLSVANGYVEKHYSLSLYRVNFYHLIFFPTITILLNIFYTLKTVTHSDTPISLNCGMTLHVSNGGLSFVCTLPLNILGFILKTLLFLLSIILLILLIMILLQLNILFVTLTDNFILPKLPNAGRII